MAYTTQAQVQIAVGGLAKLIELTDQDSSGVVNATVLAQAINEADAIINSYVGKRFAVPLPAPVPDVLQNLSAAWAARNLRRNLYQGAPQKEDGDQEIVDRAWLADVAKGLVSLGVEPNPIKASIVTDKASTRDPSLTVSRLRTRGAW